MRLADLVHKANSAPEPEPDPAQEFVDLMTERRVAANEYLVLLMAYDHDQEHTVWRRELADLMEVLAEIRVRGKTDEEPHPIPQKLYCRHMWENLFGGSENATMEKTLNHCNEGRPHLRRNAKTVPNLVRELREWHTEAGRRIEAEENVRAWVVAIT